MQSLFADFFAANPGPNGPPKSRQVLWRPLIHFTMCKVAKTAERHRAARRDVCRERRPPHADQTIEFELADAGRGPEDEVIARDEFAHILGLLPADLREIFLWKLEGFTNAEIATWIGCIEHTVELKMQTIRGLLGESVGS